MNRRLTPVNIQQRFLFPMGGRGGGRGGRGAPAGPNPNAVTVTVTPASGPAVSGVLVNIDDSESQGAGEKPADRPTSGTRKPVAPGNRNSVAPASTSAPVSARSPVTAPAPESARRSARPDTAETYLGLDDELNFTMRFGGSDVAMPEFLQRRWDHFRKLDRAEKAERLYSGMLRFTAQAR